MKTKFKYISILSIIIIIFLISACSNNQLVDNNNTQNNIVIDNEQVRPNIPINSNPDNNQNLEGETNYANQKQYTFYSFLNSDNSYFTNSLEGFRIGNNHEPFTIGKHLGDIVPYLTENELISFISKPAGFDKGSLRAKQFIRFDFDDEDTDVNENSGLLRFTRDEHDDSLNTELFFKEDKPIFELAYLLLDGSFMISQGEEIGLFGVNYVIQESYNTSILLFGVDKEQYIELRNGSELRVNNKIISNTLVEVDPWHFTIKVFADDQDGDGIILKKGDSLRDKLPAEVFFNDDLNLIFEGVDDLNINSNNVLINSHGDEVSVKTTNLAGELMDFDIAIINEENDEVVVHNKNNRKTHLKECEKSNDYCILEDDKFLMIDSLGKNYFMTFTSATEYGKFLKFKDHLGEMHTVKTSVKNRIDDEEIIDYNEENNATNETMIALIREGAFVFEDQIFKINSYYNRSTGKVNISVDLNSDSRINGEGIPLMIDSASKLLFNFDETVGENNVFNNISFIRQNTSRNRNFINNDYSKYDEIFNFKFKILNNKIRLTNNKLNFEKIIVDGKDKKEINDYLALTTLGSEIKLIDANDDLVAEDVLISSSPLIREGIVIVKG